MGEEEILEKLREGIREYDEDRVKEAAQKVLDSDMDPLKAIKEGLTPAIREMGDKFDKMEIYLPELTRAAKAMEAGVAILEPALSEEEKAEMEAGKIIIGTVKGDDHDIGKNIVITMLKSAGFDVIDLGKDVPVEKFVEEAERNEADIVAASALMSFTKEIQRDLIEYMESTGVRDDYKVMVGGGPVTEEWVEEIGADATAKDASKAVEKANELMGISE